MPPEKLYAGAKLRELRTRVGLTQKDFAAKLKVSLPYLNQMENNNRPVSTTVILGLARDFGFDVTELGSGDTERLVSDMREALADAVFTESAPPLSDLRLAASNAPALARAFLDLHRAYRQTHERLASLDEALGQDSGTLQSPWEEVRDFFHYCDNYIDAVDRAAERFAGQATGDLAAHTEAVLSDMGISLRFAAGEGVRHYDRTTRTLTLSPRAAPETQRFQLLHQYALLGQAQLLEATLDLPRFQTDTAREIARIGMANYFAGAVLMPYTRFATAARETRHDLEQLSIQFGASIEQIAHRLSTLQRPGAKGVPFFFARVDQAGTVTKRHSATRL
jgi:transcriptional regulator with XRE-family HTH domain